jgi:hypothetical protein
VLISFHYQHHASWYAVTAIFWINQIMLGIDYCLCHLLCRIHPE